MPTVAAPIRTYTSTPHLLRTAADLLRDSAARLTGAERTLRYKLAGDLRTYLAFVAADVHTEVRLKLNDRDAQRIADAYGVAFDPDALAVSGVLFTSAPAAC